MRLKPHRPQPAARAFSARAPPPVIGAVIMPWALQTVNLVFRIKQRVSQRRIRRAIKEVVSGRNPDLVFFSGGEARVKERIRVSPARNAVPLKD